MNRHAWVRAVFVVCACWLLAGCATHESGYKISDETIAFIQPGVTTRSEVIENLGTPLFELQKPHVVAYSWGKLRATAGTRVSQDTAIGGRQVDYPMGATPAEEGGLVETKRWICCIALDDGNRVIRLEKLKLEGAASLEQAVRQWAETNPR